MNKFIGTGRLTKDPIMRSTQSGKAVCQFTLAMDGYRKEDTTFINVIAWDKMGEACGQYLCKGQKAIVEGRIQVRSYDANGQKRYATEIIAQHVEFGEKPKGSTGYNGIPGQEVDDIPF